jgi:hypothetical protein
MQTTKIHRCGNGVWLESGLIDMLENGTVMGITITRLPDGLGLNIHVTKSIKPAKPFEYVDMDDL